MALVNGRVLVQYDVGGPRLFHERMVPEHIDAERYVVVTPDRDVYVEELSLLNSDIRSMRVRGANSRLPADVPAGEVYALPNWPPNEVARLRDEARAVAERERGGVVAAAPVGVVAAGPVNIPATVGDASEDMKFSAGTVKWLSAESGEGFRYGQEVPGVTAPLARGSKAIHTLSNGHQLFVECVDGADLEKFKQKPSLCDDRILLQVLNAMQQPERSLKDIASACV